ncbi:MAG: hypothetical protein IKZ46_13065 [Victivallales bacterium]|nr:hypothetical protein [Victivallales bacterium]
MQSGLPDRPKIGRPRLDDGVLWPSGRWPLLPDGSAIDGRRPHFWLFRGA